MKQPLTLEAIRQMPKVELHRHLDGAVRPKLVWELAKKQGLAFPQKDVEELAGFLRIRPGMMVDEILAQFGLVISLMQAPENIERVCYEQVHDLCDENIIYAELRFAPTYHTRAGLFIDEVVGMAVNGFRRGMADTGILVNTILCIARECDPETAKQVARSALRFVGQRGVVGIDLACNEAAYPPELHKDAYELTLPSSEIFRTVHAGEFGNDRLKNIKTSLFDLRADRLGHAIPLVQDPGLMMICKAADVGIESCPLSNLICGNISNLKELGLDVLLASGIRVSINSDDPQLFHVSLSETILETARVYHWGMEEIRQVMRNAVMTAFIPQRTKDSLLKYFK